MQPSNESVTTIAGRRCALFGDPGAGILLIQPADADEWPALADEWALIRERAGDRPCRLAAFSVDDWNDELSPWPAPPVFGDHAFGGRAAATLDWVLNGLLPALGPAERAVLGGYSLAGLFALWAARETDAFRAVAAASPSVWFPGWGEYANAHPMRAERVYLSLGDRESRTRNPVMARVGDAIREEQARLDGRVACVLEWNPGNHFRDARLRTAKAFAWAMNRG